jgi:hypothetical protein
MISKPLLLSASTKYKYLTHTHIIMAEREGKPPCPKCGLKGRVRVRGDESIVCNDCGYDSRKEVEEK